MALALLLICAPWIDSHMHLVESRGGGYVASADRLVRAMDEAGVRRAVVLPPPMSPAQPGAYSYRDLLPALRRHSNRLALAAGGDELSQMLVGTPPDAVTPEIRARFRASAERILADGAVAFGEMTALHYSFSPRHSFKQVPADHPLFLDLADLAARAGAPIDLHMEALLEDGPTPAALRERSARNPSTTRATIPAFERLLAHNRDAKIVWTHVGWDNTGNLTPALVRRLLEEHSNLYCAIKCVAPAREPFRVSRNDLVDAEGRIRPAWLSVVRAHPDRFLVGADEFILPAERGPRRGPPSFSSTWRAVAALPEDVRDAVGGGNAARIYRLLGN